MYGDARSAPAAPEGGPAAYAWRMPAGWWLKNHRYFMYMMRELSAVFAALWVVLFLAQLPGMAAGPHDLSSFNQWRALVSSPAWVIFSLTTFVFVLYHAFTWINLMGTVIHVRMGETRLTGKLVVSLMLVAWAGISVVIGFVLATPAIGG